MADVKKDAAITGLARRGMRVTAVRPDDPDTVWFVSVGAKLVRYRPIGRWQLSDGRSRVVVVVVVVE